MRRALRGGCPRSRGAFRLLVTWSRPFAAGVVVEDTKSAYERQGLPEKIEDGYYGNHMDEIALMESIASSWRRLSAKRVRPFEISLLQYRLILLARRKGSVSLSQAAEGLGCDRPGMTLLARKCVRSGWLRRRRSAADRRSHRLELTGEGEELLDAIEAAQASPSAAAADPLDVLAPAEREALAGMLRRVRDRAEELRAGR